jgi:homopolymeric O-antigen transport system permease protein
MPILPVLVKGAADIRGGLAAYELWGFMGWQDIRQRYRRTILGPWWLAISTGLLVLGLGVLWSELFHVDVHSFLPFFVIGYVLWMFLSGVLNEACTGFTQFEGYIKQQRIPFSVYLYRIGMRHVIILAHNAVVVVVLVLWAGPVWSLNNLWAIPGLVVFGAAVLMMSVPVAILCTRFRDLPQIVNNVLQMAFFFTPIFWRPDTLQNFRWIADYNPLAHLIDIVRLPLLGTAPGVQLWLWSVAILASSIAFGAWLLGRYGHRLAYWL